MDMKWSESRTLGGKEKIFWWHYDGNKIFIKRIMKDKSIRITFFDNNQIDMILDYINKSDRVVLANSMSKLEYDTEKDGIGKYIYNSITKDKLFAQSASQLVAIFVSNNVLNYNGKKTNMEFWIQDINWKENLLIK